ncbi:MAG: hypothetical protein AYK18_08230 [Theionarchaea archaeon DG-70]|nr:MAG: hypothetical protein AYK18_08230 [Theionarchaea archaeon DG-70]
MSVYPQAIIFSSPPYQNSEGRCPPGILNKCIVFLRLKNLCISFCYFIKVHVCDKPASIDSARETVFSCHPSLTS